MSSDMMIISKEDDSSFEGKNSAKAIFVDECSMGEPWTEFGRWFQERYCHAPSIIEQMHGLTDHNHIEFTQEDAKACKDAFKRLKHADNLKIDFDSLVGKHISTENW